MAENTQIMSFMDKLYEATSELSPMYLTQRNIYVYTMIKIDIIIMNDKGKKKRKNDKKSQQRPRKKKIYQMRKKKKEPFWHKK